MKRFPALLLFFAWLLPAPALAARLLLENSPPPAAGEISVRVELDTQGENVNAFAGKILFPEDLLAVEELRDGNSTVNFWIKKPAVQGGSVEFAGLTPGGLRGSGLLFEIVFLPLREGSAQISAQELQFLLNDGRGTPIETLSGTLNLAVQASRLGLPQKRDSVPPEIFLPVVSRSPSIFDGKYFLAFATQDKGSGIAAYYVAESRHRWGNPDWQPASSPYVLGDQELKSYIYVKAVDLAGNERVAAVPPENAGSAGEMWLWSIITLMGVLAVVLSRLIKAKREK